jgi:hypothetical protein
MLGMPGYTPGSGQAPSPVPSPGSFASPGFAPPGHAPASTHPATGFSGVGMPTNPSNPSSPQGWTSSFPGQTTEAQTQDLIQMFQLYHLGRLHIRVILATLEDLLLHVRPLSHSSFQASVAQSKFEILIHCL